MNKFGRNYVLQVGVAQYGPITTPNPPILIKNPFTVEFDITRTVLTSANSCSFRIYNLSEAHRNAIRFNFYNSGELRPIVFQAGYGDSQAGWPIVFTGNITQAWSVREGTDYVTTIECFDGGFAFANATYNGQFIAGTPYNSIISTIANSMGQFGVNPGYIGTMYSNQTLARGATFSGNPCQMLAELTNGGFFIDNGKVNCIGVSEYIPGGISKIDSSTGLLGTPVLQQTLLTFDMIFEPGVIIGQQVQLNSKTAKSFSGPGKIVSVKHHGTISGAVSGNAITSLGMYWGSTALTQAVNFI